MPASKRRQELPRPGTTRKIAGRTSTGRVDSGFDTNTREHVGRDRQFDDSASAEFGDTDGSSRQRRGVNKLAVFLLVLGLVAGAVGLFLRTSPGLTPDNSAFVDQASTDEVAQLAATHAQRLVAIDHSELDAYHASLDEFLSPELVAQLNESWDALSETYEQSQTVVDAHTENVGVSFLTDDHAEVLLILNVSMTRDGVAAGSTSGTHLVEMSQIDGDWKLSSIPDLPS